MADEKKIVGLEITVPDSVDHAADNLLGPPTKGIGQTIGDLWYLVFGGITQCAEKRRIKWAHDLENLREILTRKLDDIPEGKRVEPSTQVVMSALSDAQYCVEEAVFREMFANLIASSINADTASMVHPSFSGIIKQMSPIDAKILTSFRNRDRWPIVNYLLKTSSDGSIPLQRNVFIGLGDSYGPDEISASIDCLSMFGLITTDFIRTLTDKSKYDIFKSLALYLNLKETVSASNAASNKADEVDIQQGFIEITDMGKRFIGVCMA